MWLQQVQRALRMTENPTRQQEVTFPQRTTWALLNSAPKSSEQGKKLPPEQNMSWFQAWVPWAVFKHVMNKWKAAPLSIPSSFPIKNPECNCSRSPREPTTQQGLELRISCPICKPHLSPVYNVNLFPSRKAMWMEQLILLFRPPFLPFSVHSWHYLQVLANLVPENCGTKQSKKRTFQNKCFSCKYLNFNLYTCLLNKV